MMRSLLLIFFTLCLHSLLSAQTPDTTAPKPGRPKLEATKRAAQQLKRLQKLLNLTDDQVLQFQVILINRDIAMDSIARRHPVGPPAPPSPGRASDFRRSDNRARRRIQQDADNKINALLTDDQKPLYQQWKRQQREKLMEKRRQNQLNNPAQNNNR